MNKWQAVGWSSNHAPRWLTFYAEHHVRLYGSCLPLQRFGLLDHGKVRPISLTAPRRQIPLYT